LPDGPGCFKQDFSCPALLRIPLSLICFRVRGYHPLWPNFPVCSTSHQFKSRGPTTPKLPEQLWFGLFPFRSPLLWESLLFSLPPVNEMFQFTGFAPCITGYPAEAGWVVPFGNPRIDSYLPIPAAYRSLSRPSSPLRAKASSVRPCLFSFALFPIYPYTGPKNFCLL
jgi:hypothetical protein